MAEMLLSAGAKVEVANEYGETPLTLACLNGDAAVAARLLKAARMPKPRRWNGETALMIASAPGSAEIVGQLIAVRSRRQCGGNPARARQPSLGSRRGPSGSRPVAHRKGRQHQCRFEGGFTALVFASSKNDAKSVKALLAAGADPNYALPDGRRCSYSRRGA